MKTSRQVVMIYRGNILQMIKLEQTHMKSPIIDYIRMDPNKLKRSMMLALSRNNVNFSPSCDCQGVISIKLLNLNSYT